MKKEDLKKIIRVFIICIILEIIIAFGIRGFRYFYYNDAISNFESGEFDRAQAQFENISKFGEYKETNNYIYKIELEKNYEEALNRIESKKYEEALSIIIELGDYKDSKVLYDEVINAQSSILNAQYEKAIACMKNKNYEEAISLFQELETYQNSEEMLAECNNMKLRAELGNRISAGTRTTCAISSSGTGLIEINDVTLQKKQEEAKKEIQGWHDLVSISANGYYACGLTIQGDVLCEQILYDETDYNVEEIESIHNAIQIDTGTFFVTALTADGKVITKGKYTQENGYLDTSKWTNIKQIAAGRSFVVGIMENGDLIMAGRNVEQMREEYEANKDKWTDIRLIVAAGGENNKDYPGGGHILGLKSSGEVVSLGDNSYGQRNVDDWSEIVDISAGDWHSVGLKKDGTVLVVGEQNNHKHSCEDWTDIKEIDAGFGYTIGVTLEDELVYKGFDHNNGVKEASKWDNL